MNKTSSSGYESSHTGWLIAVLWLYTIFNIVFRDIHELTKAGTIEQILAGRMNGEPVTDTALLIGAFAVQLLLLAPLLSATLRADRSRLCNLTLAPLAAFGVLYAERTDPDDLVFAAVQLFVLALIFAIALRLQETGAEVLRKTQELDHGA